MNTFAASKKLQLEILDACDPRPKPHRRNVESGLPEAPLIQFHTYISRRGLVTILDGTVGMMQGRVKIHVAAASENFSGWFVEARVGFEPTNGGFADLSLRPLGYRAVFSSIAKPRRFYTANRAA